MVLTLTPGETLRIERMRRNLSQTEAAALLGCSMKYVGSIEAGRVPSIGLELAFAIQREFGIPAESWLATASAA